MKSLTILIAALFIFSCDNGRNINGPGEGSPTDQNFSNFLEDIKYTITKDRHNADEDITRIEISNGSVALIDSLSEWMPIQSDYEVNSKLQVSNSSLPVLVKLASNCNLYFKIPSKISFGSATSVEYQLADGTWHLGGTSNYSEIIDNVVMIRTTNGYANIAIDKPSQYYITDREKVILAFCETGANDVEIKRSELLSNWEPISSVNGKIGPSDKVRTKNHYKTRIRLYKETTSIIGNETTIESEAYMPGLFSYGDIGSWNSVGVGILRNKVITSVLSESVLQMDGVMKVTMSPSEKLFTVSDLYIGYGNIANKIKTTPRTYTIYNQYFIQLFDSLKEDFLSSPNVTLYNKMAFRAITDNQFRDSLRIVANIQPVYNPDRESPYEAGCAFIDNLWELTEISHYRNEMYLYYEMSNRNIEPQFAEQCAAYFRGDLFLTQQDDDLLFMLVPRMDERSEIDLRETIVRFYENVKYSQETIENSRGIIFGYYYKNMINDNYIGEFTSAGGGGGCGHPRCEYAAQPSITHNIICSGVVSLGAAILTDGASAAVQLTVSIGMGSLASYSMNEMSSSVCSGYHPGYNSAISAGEQLYGPPIYLDNWDDEPVLRPFPSH